MNIILHQEEALKAQKLKHPWIFRSAVRSREDGDENGALARVCAENGATIGFGFYSTESKIACRLFSWGEETPPADWIARKLADAQRVRRLLAIPSDAYRLINAEGDFFPGLVIDVYGKTIVLRPHVRGVERLVPEITAALAALFPESAVYLKRDEKAARVEKLELPSGYLSGRGDPGAVPIEENGLHYLVDVREGQKTGFYLDQRDNRRLICETAGGRSVLNLFSYTGSFALAALQGGARLVDSVDASSRALELAEKNHALNASSAWGEARWIKGDGFDFLDQAGRYDLIVIDPPPFARSPSEVPGALRGYRRLETEALKRLTADGLLFTFSCSGAVDAPTFRRVFFEASLEAGRPVRLLRELHAAPDHPYSLPHREGEYLKGCMAYVT